MVRAGAGAGGRGDQACKGAEGGGCASWDKVCGAGDRRGWLVPVQDRLGGGYGAGLRKKVMKSGGGGK